MPGESAQIAMPASGGPASMAASAHYTPTTEANRLAFRRLRRIHPAGRNPRSRSDEGSRPPGMATLMKNDLERSIRTRQILIDMLSESSTSIRVGDTLVGDNGNSTTDPTVDATTATTADAAPAVDTTTTPTETTTTTETPPPPTETTIPEPELPTHRHSTPALMPPPPELLAVSSSYAGGPGSPLEAAQLRTSSSEETGRRALLSQKDRMSSKEFHAWLCQQQSTGSSTTNLRQGTSSSNNNTAECPNNSNNSLINDNDSMPPPPRPVLQDRMSSVEFIRWLSSQRNFGNDYVSSGIDPSFQSQERIDEGTEEEEKGEEVVTDTAAATERPRLSGDDRMSSREFLQWLASQR